MLLKGGLYRGLCRGVFLDACRRKRGCQNRNMNPSLTGVARTRRKLVADNWRGINDSARRISRRQRCCVKSGAWVIGIRAYGAGSTIGCFVGIREVQGLLHSAK